MRGKYQTKQQEAITAYFQERPEACLTAEAVYAALGTDVGMTTVYRAVGRLCEEGILRRYAPQNAGEAALYQLNPCRESHLHIRCLDCGALEHLRCEVVRDFSSHLLGKHGFVLDEGQTILYGRCRACQAKIEQAEPQTSPAACCCATCKTHGHIADTKPEGGHSPDR